MCSLILSAVSFADLTFKTSFFVLNREGALLPENPTYAGDRSAEDTYRGPLYWALSNRRRKDVEEGWGPHPEVFCSLG